MRLFVAVWPPDEVIGLIAGFPRPEVAGLRWTTRPQWHVTLRFLGEVEPVDAFSDALSALSGSGAEQAVLGPASSWFPGRRVLQVPVVGLDQLARRVNEAITRNVPRDIAAAEPEPRFRGHLTLARVRGRARMDGVQAKQLEGRPIRAEWSVQTVCLVASSLRPDGARYSDMTRIELGS